VGTLPRLDVPGALNVVSGRRRKSTFLFFLAYTKGMNENGNLSPLANELLALELAKEKAAAEKALKDAKKGIVLCYFGLFFFFAGFLAFDYCYFTLGWREDYSYLSGISFVLVGCLVAFLFLLILSYRHKKEAKEKLAQLSSIEIH
jgi:hypothetical protein